MLPVFRLVSMTFGRPIMTTHAQNVPLPSLAEDADGSTTATDTENPTRMSYFIQSVRLSVVLEKILDRVYQPWRNRSGSDDVSTESHRRSNFDTITEIDSQLAEFEASVPAFLSWTKARTGDKSAECPGLESLILMQRNVLRGR